MPNYAQALSQVLGHLELIETKNFGDDGTGVTSVSFSAGIDGDNDGIHVLFYKLKLTTGRYAYFRANGLNTNQDTTFWRRDIGKVNLAGEFAIGQNGASGTEHITGFVVIFPKTGVKRQALAFNTYPDGTVTTEPTLLWNCLWNTTTPNITSYDLVASVANGFKADCVASLYKLRTS